MEKRHKIIVLDDDSDWLALCRDLLSSMPSHPEIFTATTARRALALIEAEQIRLLICDLKMPRIDGLQMVAIVRRRFPELRTIVLSALEDEEFRSRAYALGVDLFWLKMEMQRNSKLFIECIEGLLDRENEPGFRGVQSKSLMDIIQMECLSRASTVLRITNGPLVARLWIQSGELVDAEMDGVRGEMAFHRLLAWKSGTFENLPAEPQRERTINKPVNALLLETAQTMDESSEAPAESVTHRKMIWKLSLLTREGADFVLVIPPEGQGEPEALGTQNVSVLAKWARVAGAAAQRLSEKLEAGPLTYIGGQNVEREIVFLPHEENIFVVGWPNDTAHTAEKSRKLAASWNS